MNMLKKLNSFMNTQDKMLLFKEKFKTILQRRSYSLQFRKFGKNSLLYHPDRIIGKKYVSIDNNVRIMHHMRMEAIDRWRNQSFEPSIVIGENVSIGQNFHITAANELVIEKNATILGNVFITDIDHEYQEIGKHVLEQPLKVSKTVIGENSFIGFGASIQAGTVLGKQCIVGTNAVVRGQFDDYSVIVGCPAKVVKKYNVESGLWERVI